MDEVTISVYCCPSFSDLLPLPLPKLNVQYRQTVCGSVWLWEGGGGVLNCIVDHILQEFYTLFLTRLRAYKIASPPQTKMTSNDDIKGLVKVPSSMIGPILAPYYFLSRAPSSDTIVKLNYWNLLSPYL
jgi:hypothetical protein